MKSWVGVDFDRTLAHYDGGPWSDGLGDPIQGMVDIVRQHLRNGDTVKVFTARACNEVQVKLIERWTRVHCGTQLEVTNVKDGGMWRLYDDLAVQVLPNTGHLVTPYGVTQGPL